RRILAMLMMCAVVLSAPHCVAQQSYAVIAQNSIPMKTRDGVTLYSDVYRPKAEGRFPVILMRTPYDKSASWAVAPAYQIATHALLSALMLPLTHYPTFNYTSLPASADATEQLAPYYLDWLAHPDYDAYWRQWSIEEHFSDIRVPALHIGAWYDIFLAGTLRNYMGIKAHGGTDAARSNQRLLIQIGGHSGFGRRIGDVEFGDEAIKFPNTDVVIDWYDYLFKGAQNEFATDKSSTTGQPVRIFVMGANTYRQESDWPPPEAKPTRYFLHSGGSANSLRGDGG